MEQLDIVGTIRFVMNSMVCCGTKLKIKHYIDSILVAKPKQEVEGLDLCGPPLPNNDDGGKF